MSYAPHATVVLGMAGIASALAWPSEATFVTMLAGAFVAIVGLSMAYGLREPPRPRREPTLEVAAYVNETTGRWHKSSRCAGYGDATNVRAVALERVDADIVACNNCVGDDMRALAGGRE